MPSLLEASIRKTVASAFKGRLLRGTLRREVTTAVDGFGDGIQLTITTFPFEGIVDNFSAAFAANAGIPITDVRILIIAGSLLTDARKDDKILISGSWHQVRTVLDIDSADATYDLACFEIVEPEEIDPDDILVWDDNDNFGWDDGDLIEWD